jgi:hypothetical protein
VHDGESSIQIFIVNPLVRRSLGRVCHILVGKIDRDVI